MTNKLFRNVVRSSRLEVEEKWEAFFLPMLTFATCYAINFYRNWFIRTLSLWPVLVIS